MRRWRQSTRTHYSAPLQGCRRFTSQSTWRRRVVRILGISAEPPLNPVSCNQSLSRWSTRSASSSTLPRYNKDGNGNWTTSSALAFAQSSRHPKPDSAHSNSVCEAARRHQDRGRRSRSCEVETRGHGDQRPRKGGRQPVHSSNQVLPEHENIQEKQALATPTQSQMKHVLKAKDSLTTHWPQTQEAGWDTSSTLAENNRHETV